MTTALHNTREAWLERAIDALRPRFAETGHPLPDRVHVSVGFGYGSKRESARILGQTFARQLSADGVNHMFISPEIGDTAEVLGVLMHECVHVALDCEDGHRRRFAEIATRLGMKGPMTEALPDAMLAFELFVMAAALGDYPHGAVDLSKLTAPVKSEPTPVGVPAAPAPRLHSGPVRQTNRYVPVVCPNDGYKVRLARSWIARGLPLCGICHTMMEIAP